MRAKSPTIGVPRMARKQAADPHLRLFGDIDAERVLTPADLETLPRASFTGGMTCNEGGRRPDARWTGVPLSELLHIVQPAATIRFLNVSAGPYAAAIDVDRAAEVILADRLEDEPITVEQGGPWRLIIPEGRLYNSVKWVDSIELSGTTPNNSAARIAQARNRASASRARSSSAS